MDDALRSAARDLDEARAALDRGDIAEAADLLAGAIAQAPTLPATHELLGHLAARADDALELFPLEQHAFVGTVVARAHLLAAAGRPEDAIPLLAAASGHTPGVDWAGVPWVVDPELGARLDPGLLARIVMQLCTSIGDPAPETDRAALTPYLALVRHTIAAHPEHPMLLGSGSALARRLAEPAEAVDWALRGARLRPSKLAEIWLGYAYRSAGRIPESLAALRRAVMYDPDDLSVYADIAGTLADDDRLDDALNWIDRALSIDPEFDCAVHTGHRLRYRKDGDLAHLVRLADFQRDHPDDSHEHTDLAECCSGRAWLGRIPEMPEAPRDPSRPPLAGALPAPSPEAVQRLTRVAQSSWAHPPAAYDAAIGLLLVEPADLLALIDNPPPAPAGAVAWDRTARVWACLGLLHHDTDEIWPGSERRRLLVDLAADGLDQIAEAALFALVTYAWVDPSARADIAAVAALRLDDAAGHGALSWSIAQLALATPELDQRTRARAEEIAHAEEDYALAMIPRPRPGGRGSRLRRWFSGR